MSRITLIGAASAAALAATAVAGQRIGLALSVVLLIVIVAAATSAPRRVDRPVLVLAVVLAIQPSLWDAGWVVTLDVVAALVAGSAAVVVPRHWPALGRSVVAPLRLCAGGAVVLGEAREQLPRVAGRQWAAVGRGVTLATALVLCFGILFASADATFASAVSDVLDVGTEPADLLWRGTLGLVMAAVLGSLVRAGRSGPDPDGSGEPAALTGPETKTANDQRWAMLGRVELLIALGALVLLFAAFVAVQMPVLFGGREHVRTTADLGYGDYARDGFVQLLVVAALTLVVVALAARHRDRGIRGLLGVLCGLTLVVLLSAHLRLDLVEDAYGLTRVRYGGGAVLLWLAAIFCVVLAAGAHPAVARRAPRVALVVSLVAIVGFSLSNPDGRVAASAVARAEAGATVDREYLRGLSADALPALRRLPSVGGEAEAPWRTVEQRLARTDGLAGLNWSRARGR